VNYPKWEPRMSEDEFEETAFALILFYLATALVLIFV